jgi:hypothetical protein
MSLKLATPSFMSKLKAKEMFWKAVCARFVAKFPTRDYTKVINVEDVLTTSKADTLDNNYFSKVISKLNALIRYNNEQYAEGERDKIKEQLQSYPRPSTD